MIVHLIDGTYELRRLAAAGHDGWSRRCSRQLQVFGRQRSSCRFRDGALDDFLQLPRVTRVIILLESPDNPHAQEREVLTSLLTHLLLCKLPSRTRLLRSSLLEANTRTSICRLSCSIDSSDLALGEDLQQM